MELGLHEILNEAYSILRKKYNPEEFTYPSLEYHQQISLPLKYAVAEIGKFNLFSGPYCLQTVIRYIHYKEIGLFDINGQTWALGRGEGDGCETEKYVGDIISFKFSADGKTNEEIKTKLMETIFFDSYYHINSVVVGNLDRPLHMGSRFAGKEEILKIKDYMIKNLYKPEFAPLLAETIENILSRSARKDI